MATLSELIDSAAQKFGVSSSYLGRVAEVESSSGQNLVNPNSSARGIFQFMPDTAAQFGISDPMDAVQNVNGAAALTAQNKSLLTKLLGRSPSDPELYLAHQQGAQGAFDLLSNPDASAASIVGNKAVALNGGFDGITAGDFAKVVMSAFTGLPVGEGLDGGDKTVKLDEKQASAVSGFFSTGLQNYFTRAIIIILGFIFVYAGLRMFQSGKNDITIIPRAPKVKIPASATKPKTKISAADVV
jgi:hypothetical protein